MSVSVCVSMCACVLKGDSFFVLDMIRIFSINAPYFGRWKKKFEQKEEHCLVVGVGEGIIRSRSKFKEKKKRKIFEEKVVAFVVFFFFLSKKTKIKSTSIDTHKKSENGKNVPAPKCECE